MKDRQREEETRDIKTDREGSHTKVISRTMCLWLLMSKTASVRFYRNSKKRVSFRRGVVQFN